MGRKEILDILLSVRSQTTVLFSTHVLSDVERICTDVALLNNGVVEVQGKLSELKTRYRREEYLLETVNDADLSVIKAAFPSMEPINHSQLLFCEGEHTVFDVMSLVAERRISLRRLEKTEPTLESLFMEVTKK